MANNVSILCAYWPFVYLLGGKKKQLFKPFIHFQYCFNIGNKKQLFSP